MIDRRTAPTPWYRRAWTAPIALWTAFLVLVWQVESHGPVTGADIRVRDRVQDWARLPSLGWLGSVGRGLADLGDQSISIPVLAVAALYLSARRRSWRPLAVALVAGAALTAVIPLKIWIGRPGPGQVTLGDATLGFFPSGHTSDAVLCYGTAALIALATPHAGTRVRRTLAAVAILLVALTVFGLLWSDYHWLSDILGAFCWCGGVLCVLRRFAAPSRDVPDPAPTDKVENAHAA
jgi:undecaprenyl-diphosphatase